VEKWTPPEEKALGVKRCKRTDCSNGLHCFLKHKERKKRGTSEGTCWACGADLIDWERVHRLDERDINYTTNALRHEAVRHEFWSTVELTDRAIAYALRKGRSNILPAAERLIQSSVGKPRDAFDGRRTPWEGKGHILHFGQHATATCCRQCMEVWHGIATDRPLAGREVDYFARLLSHYVTTRIPKLPDESMHVPRKLQPIITQAYSLSA